ncbi:MAG: hypothetical protein CVV57_01060 [Tenericutes bacterium HGW-Tenericutes-2]|jgi:hypothetical protein|nr:MAG: hypothetical protein CVV57_01060 [Tenericutes bacterium HGW-Tenericutes-2]
MAMTTFKGQGDITEIVKYLKSGIESSGMTNELVHSITRGTEDYKVYLLIFEKWYYRTSSRASLTVMLTQNEDQITVDAISAGGGQGLVFRFSWGAEENFVGVVRDLLRTKGFRE